MVSGADAAVGSDATVGTSLRLCACTNGMHSAHTPLETMLIGNRAPSSLETVSDIPLSKLNVLILLGPVDNPDSALRLQTHVVHGLDDFDTCQHT